MAKIEKFEEIVAWQVAMELCNKIYDATEKDKFSKDYALKDQIRKSAISIPSNISEGFERESNRQFIYFLVIAKGSAGELRTQLHIAKNRNYISQTEFDNLYNMVVNSSKLIGKFVSYLKEHQKVISTQLSQHS